MRKVLLVSILIVGVAAMLGIPKPVQALPITGQLVFFDMPVSALDVVGGTEVGLDMADALAFFNPVSVVTADGDFTGIGTATFSDFQFDPLTPSSGIMPLWTAMAPSGYEFSFDLTSVVIVDQGVNLPAFPGLPSETFLQLAGTGMLQSTDPDLGYYEYDWSFDATGAAVPGLPPSAQFNMFFAGGASEPPNAVPEPGTISSMIFLGLSVVGICAWDRRRVRRTPEKTRVSA